MVLAALLLAAILLTIGPGLAERGLPPVPSATRWAGLTFCGLAFVQVFSYPFHDPVLTARAFITSPKVMVKGLVLAGVISDGFIVLFGMVGLYGRAFGIAGDPTVAVPAALGLPMLLVFNAIMLTSAGSTLDSTFSSTAKLAARDWPDRHDATGHHDAPTRGERRIGRGALVAIALLGNVPLLTVYLGDQVGPAIIAATTISGTMVMGLAPIFLLSFLPRAGRASFHLAFWPGLLLGVALAVDGSAGLTIFPEWIDLGAGKYADDLGVNLYGLALCTAGYLLGTLSGRRRQAPAEQPSVAAEARR